MPSGTGSAFRAVAGSTYFAGSAMNFDWQPVRAEVVRLALVLGPVRGRVRVDHHPADRILHLPGISPQAHGDHGAPHGRHGRDGAHGPRGPWWLGYRSWRFSSCASMSCGKPGASHDGKVKRPDPAARPSIRAEPRFRRRGPRRRAPPRHPGSFVRPRSGA